MGEMRISESIGRKKWYRALVAVAAGEMCLLLFRILLELKIGDGDMRCCYSGKMFNNPETMLAHNL